MKLEFFKECLTLNYVAVGVMRGVIGLLNTTEFFSQTDKVNLVLEHCFVCFLLYKNLVYMLTRLGPRKELAYRLAFGGLFYSAYFCLKACLLLQALHFANDMVHSTVAVLLSAVVYLCAEKINDISLINNVRVTLYLVLYSK